MTIILRLLKDRDKSNGLQDAASAVRQGHEDFRVFDVSPDSFSQVPGAPFAYWVSSNVLEAFSRMPSFGNDCRTTKVGLQTSDDFRFVRCWWEVQPNPNRWFPYAKGGAYSTFYADIYLVTNWYSAGYEVKAWAGSLYDNSHWSRIVKSVDYYLRPGLTWTKSTTSDVSFRSMPNLCVFSVSGLGAFTNGDSSSELMACLALLNSSVFKHLVSLSLGLAAEGRKHYEAGIIYKTPFPETSKSESNQLAEFANRAWKIKLIIDSHNENSHAFRIPLFFRTRLEEDDLPSLEGELKTIQDKINEMAFGLFGFTSEDRAFIENSQSGAKQHPHYDKENEGFNAEACIDPLLFAWCVGVSFGRFDWRIATGERQLPPDPEPFDPLPSKSPGMLPGDAVPFHENEGILVDDPGYPHDLTRLIESVLERVNVPVPPGIRRWLQRDFFLKHLKQYSKSRRKAPIYWPLSTSSGSYTLWIYYPVLTGQTLYTAVNDFVEPKHKSVAQAAQSLRTKTNRSRQEENELEQTQDLELELLELRDTLLEIAKNYKPNHDDGVQITAAPLWPLFRHKPWQKVLKDTWKKLEKGDYDWAHLSMNYWPDRVREKCRVDKSMAIAHGLEDLYEGPAE
ncbi:MAG: hypothetical protein AB2690_21170 [Candidatus Thiodiazotropha endolucinida]